MAIRIIRDADNKWYTYIDFGEWVKSQAVIPPNGPGLTISITAAGWSTSNPPGLVEEAETALVGNIAYFVGSGGTNDIDYNLVCTITYTATELSATDLTQDKTITLRLKDQ